VQLNARVRVVLGLAAGVAVATPCAALPLEDQTAGSLLRIFTDSDHVSVRSLVGDYAFSLRHDMALSIHWNNERVTIPAIDAPPGTPEAIDAITTASRPISGNAYQDFVKVRNEFQGELARGSAALEYYHSRETDYLAQQLGARYNRDLLDQQLNLSVGTSYAWDAIDPVADDDTRTDADQKTTMHLNAIATEVLSPSTMVRVGLELNQVRGLQHNPYRNVYAGGTNVPERHPDSRDRRDAFVKLNQYFDNRSSLRLNYRFYSDDWGIASHEAGTRLSQYVTRGVFAQYHYRWYTQTAADFFRDEYESIDGIGGYRSGDYRMADLSSHLFGITLDFDLAVLAPEARVLEHMGVRFSYERYFNSNNYSANILETGLDFRF
jgi:hypothetical protein